MMKRHHERVKELQLKITALTKQMATMTKEKKEKKTGSNEQDNNGELNF